MPSTIDTAIIGLGSTGYACLRFLERQGRTMLVTDNRECPPYLSVVEQDYPHIPLYCGQFAVEAALSAKQIMLSQGILTNEPSIQKILASRVPVVSDIELFSRATEKPIIAMTGSNGKSTVTSLVSAMALACGCDARTGGNLGPPALDLLYEPEPTCYILEISNFQLERTESLQAEVACILNISPDHLDRYSDYPAYIRAKQRIYQHARIAVVNRDDPLTLPQTNVPRIVSFGLDQPSDGMFGLREMEGQTMLAFGDRLLLKTSALALPGKLGVQNSLAALAIGYAYGWSIEPMLITLQHFRGLSHRCQLVRTLDQVQYINDSKGTNVGASVAALESVGQSITGKIVWLAGGEGKGADFSELRKPVEQYVKQAILFGRDASKLASVLPSDLPQCQVPDLKTAVREAYQSVRPGDAVLLSPACASFDMFNDFQHRGDVFMACVCELPA